jgi:starch synthase (maltosyl-transferring)
MFDHRVERDDRGLFAFCREVVEYLIDLGFSGFRCDAAYKVPPGVWRRLIGEIKQRHPDVVFAAETLGCRPHQTRETAEAGFDYVFNSAKWWDFESPWLMEQYELTRQSVRSVSFPESHDTERLFHETGHNIAAQRQRYLFAALFSAGVMMPAGYEFGFTRRPHVVESRPDHWEEANIDLTGFVGAVNRVKRDWPLFQEESVTEILPHANPAILLIWKASVRGRGEALIILNKDVHQWQTFHTDNLCNLIQASPPLRDVSVDWPMDYLPAPFTFELHPGMARILVADAQP